MSRPAVGIDRLPQRRLSTEPREAMNCKSCRKRKIKCNRLRPTCEACKVFECPCIYDAVPKKRGPKTDAIEALLKRVDSLEKRLHEESKDKPPSDKKNDTPIEDFSAPPPPSKPPQHSPPLAQKPSIGINPNASISTTSISPTDVSQPTPFQRLDILLDTYFARVHGKPYYILDELTTRQRLQHHQLPSHLAYAIYAVSARYTSHPAGYSAAVRSAEDYAARARAELDTDEPSIESLQTLLLLAMASYQSGRGKKAYMFLTTAISMAFALELHREMPLMLNIPPSEREGRRRLFWACYLMDRFSACGSKRPSLITDEAVMLRLPSAASGPGSLMLEGDFFRNGSNLQYMAGPGKQGQSSTVMLIGIARILGITNRYLAAGGVKGDSHFPWHSLSNLSKIRHELDMWASETQDTFSSLENLFGHRESTMLVLSKLVYHLIHCLIYRPFLPMDLAELSITGQHQSWQIEATNLCFLHANAIAELVEIGRASSIIDWPAFVGYCVGTAGTIHVHGAHYRGREGEVYSTSPELLSREMQQLAELRFIWAGVQHQRDTLQWIYGCHSELVKSMAGNAMRFSPTLDLEDFFDRYPGHALDGAHVTFQDLSHDSIRESVSLYTASPQNPYYGANSFPLPAQPPLLPSQPNQSPTSPLERRRKRRCTVASSTSGHSTTNIGSNNPNIKSEEAGNVAGASASVSNDQTGSTNKQTASPEEQHRQPQQQQQNQNHLSIGVSNNDGSSNLQAFSQQVITPFSPGFNFSAAFTPDPSGASRNQNGNEGHYDPMFSMPTPYEQQRTPGAASAAGSSHTETSSEKDPFLTLLEQLAENEQSRGGPSELDFFLSGTQ
ncbi:fungal specific transcription factor domain-containing protein [Diplodia corticola]|uniref:Fungal specific transcription factor domain-containing protein n=1 Tax=Diplodia corticola TaxID=236234 RepID=A0A1J9RPV7_9PEZI|nr:fungal specific transcription factor domain-containing protein [Diplodia corticola]OJD29948.1 fungal specific transcription factor domain-containing protein [Diplodia corticola]